MEQPLTIEDITSSREVWETRCSLLSVLAIDMAITVLKIVIDLSLFCKDLFRTNISYESATGTSVDSDKTVSAICIIFAIIPITYLIFYIVAVFRHNRLLILIFTWITMIPLFGHCCLIILSFFSVLLGIPSSFIIPIILIIFSISPFLTVFYSFKLAKLIETQKHQIV